MTGPQLLLMTFARTFEVCARLLIVGAVHTEYHHVWAYAVPASASAYGHGFQVHSGHHTIEFHLDLYSAARALVRAELHQA